MKDRVRQIWLPSLITLFTSWTLLALLMCAGTRPVAAWHGGEPRSAVFYVPWLLLLPLIGAFARICVAAENPREVGGASMCRSISRDSHRGDSRARFGFLPSLLIGRSAPDFKFASLLANTVSWVIVPGIVLCLWEWRCKTYARRRAEAVNASRTWRILKGTVTRDSEDRFVLGPGMRLVSLLPSATETLFALGFDEEIVGVSHECDFPAQQNEECVVRSRLPKNVTPAETDPLGAAARGARGIDLRGQCNRELLQSLAPDLIITRTCATFLRAATPMSWLRPSRKFPNDRGCLALIHST